MAEKSEINPSQLEGLNLIINKPIPLPPNPAKCIICQKDGKKCEPLQGGETGRKRVRDAANLKHDVVQKRLSILGSDCEFKYHNTFACYKQYTDKRNLTSFIDEHTDEDYQMTETNDLDIMEESIHHISTRSCNTARPGPSTNTDSIYIECTICGRDRIQVNGKRIREKFRICQEESALKFLDAIKLRNDDVAVRCVDLDTTDKVFAADIYCHAVGLLHRSMI